MRGTPKEGAYGKAIDGIIPAYAGNTMGANDLPINFRDHPRVCGEHAVSASDSIMQTGSSPRMRGTLLWYGVVYRYYGIIPAYAGNT